MGLFDTIWVKCPKCNEDIGFQSKSGDCSMEDYMLEDCPEDVLSDANRHSPEKCWNCETLLQINIDDRAVEIVNKQKKKK
jgi:hypothetical protein